jgi:hypothetical protein
MGPIQHKALINVDLGEGFGNWTITSDEDLLPFIDHANIACGFHASYVFQSSFCATPTNTTANPVIGRERYHAKQSLYHQRFL